MPEIKKNIYRMSEAGGCSRAIAAGMLEQEIIPRTKGQERLLEHASNNEWLIAHYFMGETGLDLQDTEYECPKCLREFGEERQGIHIEIETFLTRLIGHLDRRAKIDGKWYPMEIKSAGRFAFDKFKNKKFEAFPEYEGQMVCYMEAEGKPGLYVVGNRDTGELLKYTVPYKGQALTLDGFGSLEVTTSFEDIADKLHLIEINVRDRELPEGDFKADSDQCRWCRVKHLCIRKEEVEQVKVEDLPTLLEAADIWLEGHRMEAMAKDRKEQARLTFLTHAKSTKIDKFQAGKIKFGYYGEKRKRYLDENKLKELVDKDILEQVYALGKPYDDVRIWPVKEE